MGDTRIHPSTTTTVDINPTPPSPKPSGNPPSPPKQQPPNSGSPPASYVVQLPREQILRYPPPENAAKFQSLTRRGKRRSCCRRCCCYTLCLLLLLAVAAAVSAGVLYLVFQFKSPQYSVTSVAIRGLNVTSAAVISPEFNVSIRADNPNGKVGIYYLRDSSVDVFFRDAKLSSGVLPAFYQPRENVTVLRTALTGNDMVLSGAVRKALRYAQSQRRVPLVVRANVPVKIKVGSAKTWQISVKVKCDVVVDALNQRTRIVSNDCGFRVELW